MSALYALYYKGGVFEPTGHDKITAVGPEK